MRKLSVVLAGFGMVIASMAGLSQITTGTITGIVMDTTGAVLPGATLQLTNVETQATRTMQTSQQGEYTFNLLPPGGYTLSAALSGFATVSQERIEVRVNEAIRVNITLPAATVRQSVEVTSNLPALQTESAATGGVVDHTQIVTLPLNGRDFIQLVALEPGAATTAKLQGGGEDYLQTIFGGNYVVNGVPPDASSYMFDGIEMRDIVDTRVSIQPTVDAIQEFNFQATNYSAAFGRSGGGIVNIVSRSGTNEFHGSAWEFLRNDVFDGTNYFATTKAPFHQNQFGGTIGGPIFKDKTFFFASYEGFRQNKGITQAVSVPTVAERNGNFSGGPPIYDPLTTNPVTGLRVPFVNNQLPSARFDPVAVNAMNLLYPLPNLPGTANNLITPVTQIINSDQINVRIDQKLGDSDTLSGRYTYVPRLDRNLPFAYSSLPNFSSVWNTPAQSAFIGETHSFGTTSVNDVKVGFNRNHQILQDPEQGTNVDQKIGITGVSTDPQFARSPNISISGLGATGTISNAPNDRTDNQFTVLDNFVRTQGRVTFAAGGSVVHLQANGGSNPSSAGAFTFNGTFSSQLNPSLTSIQSGTGNAVADFLLGFPASSSRCCVLGTGFRNWRKTDLGVYVQTDWKPRDNLTLNLGIRYEIFEAPYDISNRFSQPDLAVAPQAVLLLAGQNSVPRGFFTAPRGNVSPRVGLAYSVDPNTVVRLGYGIFFIDPQLITQFNMAAQEPFTDRDSFTSSQITPQLTLENAFPSNLSIPSSSFTAIALNFRDPYIQAWNASLQRELGFGAALTLSYVGTKGVRLIAFNLPANNPPPGPGLLATRRPIPAFSTINLNNNAGYSIYNALQVKAEKHLSQGLTFLASYAWSKCIDSGAVSDQDGGDAFAIRNPADTAANRGLCNEDTRNRFVANAIYALPFGRGESRFARQVEGGWIVGGILTFQSGPPFSVLYPTDNSNTGIGLDTPNLVAGQNPNNGPKTVADWFNLNAFTTPPPFTYGSASRNIVFGPGTKDFDFSVRKLFPIREHQLVEFRAEFFNFTNTPTFFQPGRTFATPSFGVISGAFDPRDIQFALKYSF